MHILSPQTFLPVTTQRRDQIGKLCQETNRQTSCFSLQLFLYPPAPHLNNSQIKTSTEENATEAKCEPTPADIYINMLRRRTYRIRM